MGLANGKRRQSGKLYYVKHLTKHCTSQKDKKQKERRSSISEHEIYDNIFHSFKMLRQYTCGYSKA